MPESSPLRQAQIITGWTSAELGAVIGAAPSTVRAWLSGRHPEHLTTDQIERLHGALQDFILLARSNFGFWENNWREPEA